MLQEKNTLNRRFGLVLVLIIVLALIRIYLGEKVGVQLYPDQFYDDQLLFNYSDLTTHFSEPNMYSLVKTMGYPLFLNFVRISGLSYTMILSGIWIASSLSVYSVFYYETRKLLPSLFWYSYILFFPTAFDLWMGTRLYRNAIIAPFVIIFFSLSVIIIKTIYNKKQTIRTVLLSILLGFVYTFTFIIKEDGMWLSACILFFIVIIIGIVAVLVIKNSQRLSKTVVQKVFIALLVAIIPLTMKTVLISQYKEKNNKSFGVREIETRNSGELGRFAKLIYKIDSPNRTGTEWAPFDAIEKAYIYSETFQMYPELYNAIINTPWYGGDINTNPIQGDFLTWVLRTALDETSIWQSETQVSDLFKKINDEIEQAIRVGEIKKSKKIQLVSSAGGRSVQEIASLLPIVRDEYLGAVVLKDYTSGVGAIGGTDPKEIVEMATNISHIGYLDNYNEKTADTVIQTLIQAIFYMYRVINSVLLSVSAISMIVLGIQILLKINKGTRLERNSLFWGTATFIFQGIGFAYSLSIAWFSEFLFVDGVNMIILNFYSVALPAILVFAYISGILNLSSLYRYRKEVKK